MLIPPIGALKISRKSFAKNGELRTKEFEDKQSQNTFVLIDRAVQKNFEHVVDYAASYVYKIVKQRGARQEADMPA